MAATASLTQKEKAGLFQKLHTDGKMLVLPNIWDPLGAVMLEHIGHPAIAIASASIAYTHGYPNGENIPFELLQSSASFIFFSKKLDWGVPGRHLSQNNCSGLLFLR